MGKFDHVFDPPSPDSLLRPAVTCVQASLYGRLKRTSGDRAGRLGWLLIRLGQPDHPDHRDARTSLSSQPISTLVGLRAAAVATRGAPAIAGRPETAALAQSIVDALGAICQGGEGARDLARMARLAELRATGLSEAAAVDRAVKEIP